MSESTSSQEAIAIAHELAALHDVLYTRGGIRPSNAAVEELSKLLLLHIASHRYPKVRVGTYALRDLSDPEIVSNLESTQPVKDAFKTANALPELAGRAPGDGLQSVWPRDEPLRISRTDVLSQALRILRQIPLGNGRPIDVLGTAFDVFLQGKYQHAGGLGTYLTPDSVVRAMVRIGFDLIGPIDPDTSIPIMGDPCCGSGRFLIAMLEEAESRGLGTIETLGPLVLGADQSSSAVAMARVNLLAYGLTEPEVFTVSDSITASSLDTLGEGLRLILTNPPFGDGKYDSVEGIRRTGAIFPGVAKKPRIDPSLAFIARSLVLLAPGGVLGIILPDGVMDGPSMRDLLLHSGLLEHAYLEGVLSLPTATFAPAGTMAKTSVAFIRKGCGDLDRQVFLARADHVGHVMKKGVVAKDPNGDDLPGLSSAIGGILTEDHIDEDLRSQVATVEAHTLRSIDASSLDIDALQARSELLGAGGGPFEAILQPVRKRRAEPAPQVPFLSVLHIDDLGNADWVEARKYRPTTPGIIAEPGQVIVSLLNPAKFRATVIPDSLAPVHCSPEFGVFETKLDPYAVLALLQHPLVRQQVAPLGRGTSSSRRRIDASDITQLIAPPYDDDWASKASREVCEALTAVSDARISLLATYQRID